VIEKKIEICIGTDREKHLRARLSLLVMEDGRVLSENYHAISIEPGADLAALRAANEAHIAQPGGGVPGAPWPKIPDAEWAEVEQHCAILHKPEVVSRHKARVAAERARQAELERAAKAKA
jgi:hypothetical protein